MESDAFLVRALYGDKNYKEKRLKYSLGAEKELVKISVKNVQCIFLSRVINPGHGKADTGCVYWDGNKIVLFLEIFQYFYNKRVNRWIDNNRLLSKKKKRGREKERMYDSVLFCKIIAIWNLIKIGDEEPVKMQA